MVKRKTTLLILLIILNSVVLLGQIYPEGLPPFARIVNIVFLVSSLIYFVLQVKKGIQ
jgi:hypothetical membrane protein